MYGRLRRAKWVTLLALAVSATVLPFVTASAHQGRGSGPRAMGSIVSYDGTTLTIELSTGETTTATTDEDTKVKVTHRGDHGRGKGHGNPSRGTLESLTAGTEVVKMKSGDEGVLEWIRIRPAPEQATPSPTPADSPTPIPTPTEGPTPST